jgi:hypothetical protein
MCIGLAASLAVWVRGAGAAGALAALFACGALWGGATVLAGSTWPLPADPDVLADAALLGAALCGLFALSALRRTSRELERAEDLHWDSMELVRGLRALATQPGAGLDERLERLLELGAARFGLDHGLVCRIADAGLELLAWQAPQRQAPTVELLAALEPRLRQAARSAQPLATPELVRDATPSALRDFLAATAFPAAGAPCVLAFAGRRETQRFTATDKDLIGLLADWLRGELAAREPVPAQPQPRTHTLQPPPRPEPQPQPRPSAKRPPAPARARDDLNAALRRLEPRLRALVGADASLELALADALPPLVPQRIGLEALVESLVVAACGLASGGALRLETALLAAHGEAPGAGSHATLAVRVRGGAVDTDALARAFDAPSFAQDGSSALPLAQVEELLRRAGGDLSVQVEPGLGAQLTAFLPGAPPPRPRASRADSAPASTSV